MRVEGERRVCEGWDGRVGMGENIGRGRICQGVARGRVCVDMRSIIHTHRASASPQTYGDLELFLLGLQLRELITVFKSHNVTFAGLLSLTEQDLEKVRQACGVLLWQPSCSMIVPVVMPPPPPPPPPNKMGVDQVGTRNKVLEGIANIHKKQWKMVPPDGLPKRAISCLEAAAILTNLTTHIRYLQGTSSYLLSQVHSNPDLLDPSTEPVEMKKLLDCMCSATAATDALCKEMGALESKVSKVGWLLPGLSLPCKVG